MGETGSIWPRSAWSTVCYSTCPGGSGRCRLRGPSACSSPPATQLFGRLFGLSVDWAGSRSLRLRESARSGEKSPAAPGSGSLLGLSTNMLRNQSRALLGGGVVGLLTVCCLGPGALANVMCPGPITRRAANKLGRTPARPEGREIRQELLSTILCISAIHGGQMCLDKPPIRRSTGVLRV